MTMGQPAEEQPVTLKDLVGNYLALAKRGLKYWKRGLLVFVVILVAGMVWVVNRPRVYRSEAKFQVQEIEDRSDMGEEERQRSVDARISQVWNSRRNLLQLIADHHLYDHLQGRTSESKLAELFTGAVDRRVERDVVSIGFVYKDPDKAHEIVTAMIDLFRNARRNTAIETARAALGEVNAQLQQLEQELARKQQSLDDFIIANQSMVEEVRRRRQGAVAVIGQLQPQPQPAPVIDNRASPRTRGLRARLSQLRQNLETLRNPGSESRPSADEPQELRDARERVRAKEAEVASLRSQNLTMEHPRMTSALRELMEARGQLDRLASRHRGSMESAANISAGERARRIEDVQREIRETEAQLVASERADAAAAPAPVPGQPTANAPSPTQPVRNSLTRANIVEVEAEYDRYTTDLTTTRTSYQELLRRKFDRQSDLRRAETSGGERIRVIDPPSHPIEPEPPGRAKLSMIVGLIASLLALGVALVSGFIDTRVYDLGDLQRWGEIADLPFIPDLFVDLPDGGARLAAQAAQGPPGGSMPPSG